MDRVAVLNPSLGQLAFACYVYDGMENYDSAYRGFLVATNHDPDLSIKDHRIELLQWLNKWGGRRAQNAFDELSEGLRLWYAEGKSREGQKLSKGEGAVLH